MPQVDGLRAVALLGVMLAHFLPLNAGVLNFGLFGVSIFFCLSGYLITTSLLSIRDQRFRLRWSVTIRETYLRRWVRLSIPLYVCLASGFLLNIHPVRASWSWHALYLSNLYMTLTGDWQGRTIHFWYLAVDCQVFLLWPWFILYTPKRALLPALISLVCVAPLLRLTMTLAGANVQAQDTLPLFWVAPIALGAILGGPSDHSPLCALANGLGSGVWVSLGIRASDRPTLRNTGVFAHGPWDRMANLGGGDESLPSSDGTAAIQAIRTRRRDELFDLSVARIRRRDHPESPFLHTTASRLVEVCCKDGRRLDAGRARLVVRGTST
jgi:hypothetical protein